MNYSKKYRRLPLAAAIGAIALGGSTAFAQDDTTGGYNLVLEEVVVTAQKREENFMSVPIAVNAFTAQDMANTGVVSIQGIDDYMPGVEITDFGGGSTQAGITIRGIDSPNISSGQDPSVATFYDGAYMPRAATTIPFTDIARTEVLKGPQGTLFGRNATAGVVNIVPNKPTDQFESFARTRLGNEGLLQLEGMVNAPVTDDLAFRGNVFTHNRGGFNKQEGIGDDVQDRGFSAARGALLWALGDNTDIQLAADYEDRDEMPRAAIGVSPYANSTDPFDPTAHDVVGQEETREMYGVSLQVNHDFSDMWSAFGIVSYRDWETTNLQEEDGTAATRRYLDTNNIENSDILYTEFRLNFTNDRWNVIGGFNYSEEAVSQRTDIGLQADSYMQLISADLLPVAQELGLIPADVVFDQDSHIWDFFPNEADVTYLLFSQLASDIQGVSTGVLPPRFAGTYYQETMDNTGEFTNWGIFADATYQLTDTLRLAGGLRYSYDEKDYSWQTHPIAIDWSIELLRVNYQPAETGAPESEWFNQFSAKDDWSETTGRLVLDWEFSDNAMTYASYSTGYKSGGFDGQSFESVVAGPFGPETIEAVEIGLKGDFFDNVLRVEAAVFYQELEGRQRSEDAKSGPDDPTAAPTVISSDLQVEGIELTVTWNALDNLRLAAMTTFRDGEETSELYFNSDGELVGGTPDDIDAGDEYTLVLDWTPEISTGYLLVHMDYVYREETGPNDGDAIFTTGRWYFEDEEKLNARVAWSDPSDTWEVALWGRNLLDQERAGNPGGLAADAIGAYHTRPDDTITYGVDLRYSF